MDNLAIKVDNISKIYRLYSRNLERLIDTMGISRKIRYREHYALRDVNFQVEKGETVGIIGTNGAGKSTMLKIITGVLTPNAGTVAIDGRISALLELGAGFNPEYTGLENVYLNGTLIGFSKEEMNDKLPKILEFADIGDYIHQPVRTYSSGMFVRLAFAVAINIEPEILIVDEALSVGDVFFQAKCYKKFEDFRTQGKTILFVSHDLSSISKYCDKVILLNNGIMMGEGSPKEMINLYKKVLVNQADFQVPEGKSSIMANDISKEGQGVSKRIEVNKESLATVKVRVGSINKDDIDGIEEKSVDGIGIRERGSNEKQHLYLNKEYSEYGTMDAEFIDFAIYDDKKDITSTVAKGATFTIAVKLKVNRIILSPIVAFTITNLKGDDVSGTNTFVEREVISFDEVGDEVVVTFSQKMDFQGGEYLLSLGCTGYEGDEFTVYHRLYDICSITVVSSKDTVGYFDMNSEIEVEVLR